MPCCGLIAFLLAQPILLWDAAKSWVSGTASLGTLLRAGAGMVAFRTILVAEVLTLALGAAMTTVAWQADMAATDVTIHPLGRICTVLSHLPDDLLRRNARD